MTMLTINLSEDLLSQLQTLARRLKVEPDELVRAGIAELVTRPETEFEQLLEHVLQKNTELYRRLAAL